MEWRLIEAWPDYEISESGLVRKIATKLNLIPFKADGLRRVHGAGAAAAKGYWAVVLWDSVRRKKKTFFVHRLVCEVFHGPQPSPERKWVAHWDDDRDNNHYSNLRWATPKENYADSQRNGTNQFPPAYNPSRPPPRNEGEDNPRARLNRVLVHQIRADRRKAQVVAMDYGVSVWTIRAIRCRKAWSSV